MPKPAEILPVELENNWKNACGGRLCLIKLLANADKQKTTEEIETNQSGDNILDTANQTI